MRTMQRFTDCEERSGVNSSSAITAQPRERTLKRRGRAEAATEAAVVAEAAAKDSEPSPSAAANEEVSLGIGDLQEKKLLVTTDFLFH